MSETTVTFDADATMAASRAVQTPDQETSHDERPEWLPEKFKTPADMAKAYTELETKLGAGQPTPPVSDPPSGTETVDGTQSALDFTPYRDELTTTGQLSEKSVNDLVAKGIPKEMIDSYLAGAQALSAQHTETIMSAVGGPEVYGQMTEWAKTNLSPAEIGAFNRLVNDPVQADLAVRGLYAKYTAAVGSDDQSLVQGVPAVGGIQPFKSSQELVAAMQDERYRNGDMAYHAQVRRRLSVSNY